MNPNTHSYSQEHVQNLKKLDHWGSLQELMDQASDDWNFKVHNWAEENSNLSELAYLKSETETINLKAEENP